MIFFTGSQLILEAALHTYSVEKLFWKFSENSQENNRDGGYFSKVAVLETANSDRVFEEHFATNHCFQHCYWFVCIEKINFPESYFVSNSFLKSLLFSVISLFSDSGSSWLWVTFSLKHFEKTFQTKSLLTAIFSVYWFRKHCLG